MGCRLNFTRWRRSTTRSTFERYRLADRRGFCDDAMGYSDGPVRIDNSQSLDLARRWCRFWCSAVELYGLASDFVAFLSGFCALSAPTNCSASTRHAAKSQASTDCCPLLRQHGLHPYCPLGYGTARRG